MTDWRVGGAKPPLPPLFCDQEELRQLVGEHYHNLIAACDMIGDMGATRGPVSPPPRSFTPQIHWIPRAPILVVSFYSVPACPVPSLPTTPRTKEGWRQILFCKRFPMTNRTLDPPVSVSLICSPGPVIRIRRPGLDPGLYHCPPKLSA